MKMNENGEIVMTQAEAKDLLLCYRVWSNTVMEEIVMGDLDETKTANIRRTSSNGNALERLLYENNII